MLSVGTLFATATLGSLEALKQKTWMMRKFEWILLNIFLDHTKKMLFVSLNLLACCLFIISIICETQKKSWKNQTNKKTNQPGTGAHNRRGQLSKYSCYGVYTDQFIVISILG